MNIWENIMNLWRLMNIDKYLYEIIDDYKNAGSDKEKNSVFSFFCSSIWASENKRRVYTKTLRYSVRKDLLKTDIGKVFDMWSEVEYTGYKSMWKETDWCSLIRQKVNNLYIRYFDKEVILKRDYMYLLNTPKRFYYQWIDGMEMNLDELTTTIDEAMDKAEKLKVQYQKQKIELSWADYKRVTEEIFQKIFFHCKLIEDYENGAGMNNVYDFINEDHFYISYFCKYLENEMKQWQKKYYGVRNHKKYTHCKICGRLIEKTNNRILYCKGCSVAVNREKCLENIRRKRMFDLEKS